MTDKPTNPGGTRTLGERIAGQYSAYLLRSMCVILAVFTCVFWVTALWRATSVCAAALKQAQEEAWQPGAYVIGDAATTLMTGDPPKIGFWPHRVDGQLCLVRGREDYVMAFSLAHDSTLFVSLFVCLAAMELIRMLVMRRKANDISRKALQPISAIADAAKRLSARNLSQRIPAEGARGELKDLTNVLNSMLDRIESAYDSQVQFVSDASHELRTPIAVIQGYADMLSRWGQQDEAVREEAITAIKEESRAMKVLVEQLLFIARHEKSPQRYKMAYFDLCSMAQEAVKETRLIAGEHTILEGGMESAIVLGDRDALKQALRVFLDNALKYTQPDGVITVSCARDGSFARLTVADNGRGIAEEDLKRVFDRFYRAPEVRGGEVDGHGLGLSIARIIVQAHGGRMEVQSKPGEGSRFSMLLRL